jgi:dolichol-phosphate mannosyltransferase
MILMSRRYGQPAASIAGLSKASGEVCILIDADLQDPPELIVEMYAKYLEGFHVVHTKRKIRRGEKIIRLAVTHFGYWLINKLSSTDIPRNVGEYKLFSRRALDALLLVKDKNIFIKGLVSYIGFKQVTIEYDRDARASGEPHYSQLFGSISLSLHGLFCYSNVPLHYISLLGFISTIFSALLIVGFIIGKIIGINFASGLVTIIVVTSFFSGIIIFSIGILGEYIGRIFDEIKDRPRYIIDEEYL